MHSSSPIGDVSVGAIRADDPGDLADLRVSAPRLACSSPAAARSMRGFPLRSADMVPTNKRRRSAWTIVVKVNSIRRDPVSRSAPSPTSVTTISAGSPQPRRHRAAAGAETKAGRGACGSGFRKATRCRRPIVFAAGPRECEAPVGGELQGRHAGGIEQRQQPRPHRPPVSLPIQPQQERSVDMKSPCIVGDRRRCRRLAVRRRSSGCRRPARRRAGNRCILLGYRRRQQRRPHADDPGDLRPFAVLASRRSACSPAAPAHAGRAAAAAATARSP